MAAYPEKLLQDYSNIESAFRTESDQWSNKVFDISKLQISQIIEKSKDDDGVFQIEAITKIFTRYDVESFKALEGKDERGKKLSGTRTYAFIYTIASGLAEYASKIEDESVKNEIFELVSTLCRAFHMDPKSNSAQLSSTFLDKDSSVFVRLTILIDKLIKNEEGVYLNSGLDKLLASIFLCVRCIDFGIYTLSGSSFFYVRSGYQKTVLDSLEAIEGLHRDLLNAKEKKEGRKEEGEEGEKAEGEEESIAIPKNDLDDFKVFVERIKRSLEEKILSLEIIDIDKEKNQADKAFYKDLNDKIQVEKSVEDKIRVFFMHIQDKSKFEGLLICLDVAEQEIPAYLNTYDSYHDGYFANIFHYTSGIDLSDTLKLNELFDKISEKKEMTAEEKASIERHKKLQHIECNVIKLFSNIDRFFDERNKVKSHIDNVELSFEDGFMHIHELLLALDLILYKDIIDLKGLLMKFPSLHHEVERIEAQLRLLRESLENKKNELASEKMARELVSDIQDALTKTIVAHTVIFGGKYSLNDMLENIDKSISELYFFLSEVKGFQGLLKTTYSLPGSVKNIEEQLISSIEELVKKKNKLVAKKDEQFIEKQNIDHFMGWIESEEIGEIQFTYKRCIKKLKLEYSVLEGQYDISKDNDMALLQFNNAVDMIISEALKESSGASLDALHKLSQLRQEFSPSSSASFSSSPRLSEQQGRFFNSFVDPEEALNSRKKNVYGFISQLKSDAIFYKTYNCCIEKLKEIHDKFLIEYDRAQDFDSKKQELDAFERSIRDTISEKIKGCDTPLSTKKLITLEQEFCKVFGSDERMSRASIRNSRGSRIGLKPA